MSKSWFRIGVRQLAIAFLLVLLSPLAAGSRYAVLVGVSNYPKLNSSLHLLGPKNDVDLVRTTLKQFGFEDSDIEVLADGVPRAQPPTRKRILEALRSVTARAGQGDFVFLYFAGHGSQQPVVLKTVAQKPENRREMDGLDEIFLAYDIESWDQKIGLVKNAIVDDEIGEILTAMRRRKASVFLGFDSCHSGMMSRGYAVTDLRERRVSPTDLGIPAQQLSVVASGLPRSRGIIKPESTLLADIETEAGGDLGAYVAFYATQTTESTPEILVSTGSGNQLPYGLFTYYLMQTIASNPGATYRQVGQQLLQTYASINHQRPTPLFEGTALDAPVFFGTESLHTRPQWRVSASSRGFQIEAGRLHQVTPESILAIVPNPVADDDEVLGYVSVNNSELIQSRAESLEFDNKPALDPTKVPKTAYARMIEPNISFQLRVAELPAASADPAVYARVKRVLDDIKEDPKSAVQITWVKTGENPNLRLVVKDDRIWLLPPSAELLTRGRSRTPSIPLSGRNRDMRKELQESLTRIAKVINLLRLANHAGRPDSPLALTLKVKRQESDQYELVESGKQPTFYHDDEVQFLIGNKGTRAIDVTLLFIDSEHGISPLFPYEPGEVNRIEAGGEGTVTVQIDASETVGLERVIGIAVPAVTNAAREDFSFLAQPRLSITRSGKDASPFEALLEQAGFHGGKSVRIRGIKRRPSRINEASMGVISWYTARE